MGMPNLAHRWTREMVLAMPEDGNRYELLDGELLVTPAPGPRHQDAVAALFTLLAAYLRELGSGGVYFAPADLQLDGSQYLQPDLFVVPTPEGRRPDSWAEAGTPWLVIEVGSPSTARYDRLLKRGRYLRAGVPEYWVVDLDAAVVERWTRSHDRPEVLGDRLEWQPVPDRPPLALDLPSLFAEISRGH
jgi:Uma2 family endonuclease